MGQPSRAETPAPVPEGPLAAAAEVQRAGSAYVSALSRLDESSGAIEREQGVDAALSTLQGAAWELVRLRPDDPQAGRILYTVSEARPTERSRRSDSDAGMKQNSLRREP